MSNLEKNLKIAIEFDAEVQRLAREKAGKIGDKESFTYVGHEFDIRSERVYAKFLNVDFEWYRVMLTFAELRGEE